MKPCVLNFNFNLNLNLNSLLLLLLVLPRHNQNPRVYWPVSLLLGKKKRARNFLNLLPAAATASGLGLMVARIYLPTTTPEAGFGCESSGGQVIAGWSP